MGVEPEPVAQPISSPPEEPPSPAAEEAPAIDMEHLEVDGPGALEWVQEGALLLDIREPHEIISGHATAAFLLPMNQVPHRTAELPHDRKIVVYCAAEARSFGVAGYLREQGISAAYSLSSGFGGWTGSRGGLEPAGYRRSLLVAATRAHDSGCSRPIRCRWEPSRHSTGGLHH